MLLEKWKNASTWGQSVYLLIDTVTFTCIRICFSTGRGYRLCSMKGLGVVSYTAGMHSHVGIHLTALHEGIKCWETVQRWAGGGGACMFNISPWLVSIYKNPKCTNVHIHSIACADYSLRKIH